MKCSQLCANEASHTFYRLHFTPVNVCDAHLYVCKSTLQEGEYMVKPLTLAAHIEDYEKKKQPGHITDGSVKAYNHHYPQPPLATQLRELVQNVHTMGMSDQLIGIKPHYYNEQLDKRAEYLETLIAKQVQEARNEFYDSYVKELRHTVIREGDTIMLFELCNSAARHAAGLEERE